MAFRKPKEGAILLRTTVAQSVTSGGACGNPMILQSAQFVSRIPAEQRGPGHYNVEQCQRHNIVTSNKIMTSSIHAAVHYPSITITGFVTNPSQLYHIPRVTRMAEYGEGYTDSQETLGGEGLAEERHEVGGSKRGSKDSSSSKPKRKRSCPVYFGVKSYLDQFYDTHSYKDPDVYEDDDHQYLLQPHQRRRRCTPIWWKLFMWIGVTLLLFGVIGILIGYLVPPRHVMIRASDSPSGDAYVDEKAQEYNTTLEMCKLVGLILFCIGGITLAMSLLFPSFLTHYCEDEPHTYDPAIKVPLQHGDTDTGPVSPLETSIPASQTVKSVQPSKKTEQQMLTQTSPPEK